MHEVTSREYVVLEDARNANTVTSLCMTTEAYPHRRTLTNREADEPNASGTFTDKCGFPF